MVRALRASQNTVLLTGAYILQKLVAFGYFVFLSRAVAVGPDGIARYVFAFALIAIAQVIADGGINFAFLREVARDRNRLTPLLGTALTLKVGLAFVATCAVMGYVLFTEDDPMRLQMGLLAGAVVIADALALFGFSILRGLKNLRTESAVTVINQVVVSAIGVGAMLLGFPLLALVVALLIGAGVNAIVAFRVLARSGIRLRPSWDRAAWRWFRVAAPPFFLAGVFTRLYVYSDTLILSRFLDIERIADVGYYGVAAKLTNALQFIPTALAAAAYPALSAFFNADPNRARDLFSRAFHYLTLLALPITVGTVALAGPLIRIVYGPSYDSAAPLLAIAVIALPFTFWNFLFAALLNAIDRQVQNTVNVAIAMVLSMGGNLIAVPIWGVVGAAWVILIANGGLALVNMVTTQRVFPLPWRAMTRSLLQVGAASVGAVGVLFLVEPFGLITQLIAGVGVGCLLLLALGALRMRDLRTLMTTVRSR